MRYIKPLIILFCAGLFTSCIQEEPLNAEADILACHVDESILKKDPIIQNESIQLMVKSDTDISSQAPEFTLTADATISPKSGTTRDFSKPRTYTVTSENGQYEKKYEVSYIISSVGSTFSFENVRVKNGKYDVFMRQMKMGNQF